MREHPDAYQRRVSGVLGPATKNRIAEKLSAEFTRGCHQWQNLLDLCQRYADAMPSSVIEGTLHAELRSIQAYIETGEFPLMGE